MWLMLEESALVCLHAAVAAIGEVAVVMVGPTGAGKSTLARALHDEGAEVFTDEGAFFTATDLRLHAARNDVALRPGGVAALGIPAPSEMWYEAKPGDRKISVGASPPKAPCPIDRVVFVMLDGFADQPELERCPGGEAARRLMRHMVCGRQALTARLDIAARLASAYPVVLLRVGPPRATARAVAQYAHALATPS
jgi:hypothetical protein